MERRKIGQIDCVQSDVRRFGMAGDCKATTLEAGVCVETDTEGERRSMVSWRNEESTRLDIAWRRERRTRLRKLLS